MKLNLKKQNLFQLLRNYKFGYLNIIFLLIITTLAFYTMLENKKGNGKTLNMAGKQRVLSQRSTYLLRELTQDNNEEERIELISKLEKELNRFKLHHNQIIHHKDSKDITMMETELNIGDKNLKVIQSYIKQMNRFVDLAKDNKEHTFSSEVSTFSAFVFNDLYQVLDQVVFILQRKDEIRYSVMIKTLFFLMLGRILLIGIEARFVYRPLNKSLTRKKTRLNIVKEKLSKESKSLKQARRHVIRGASLDIANEINSNIRRLTLDFLNKLRFESMFSDLPIETVKEYEHIISLTRHYEDLVTLKHQADLETINLKDALDFYFTPSEMDVRFDHNLYIDANPFMLNILIKECATLLQGPLYKYQQLKIEHINRKIVLTLKANEKSKTKFDDNKKRMLEFLTQKNIGLFNLVDENLSISFEISNLKQDSQITA